MLLVGKGGFADMAAALRSALPGDVIELAPGEYVGEVVIDKRVELRPQQGYGTVTLSATTGNTLMLLADATVRGLVIVGNAWGAAAVEVSGRVAPRIVACEIRAPGYTGLRVRAGASPQVADCRIGPALHGLRVEAASGEYRRCVFTDTALDSVVAAHGAEPHIADSRFAQQGGHAAVAVDPGTVLTLRANDFDCGPVAAVLASDGGRITVAGATIHGGGGPALQVDDGGVLNVDQVRVVGVGAEGVLISGGEGDFTACRFTGTHGPAVWMTGGRAGFEDCEAIDADRAGFLVVGGEADFVRCVAHNNAGQGFSLFTAVTLTACSSFGNGQPDDVGQHTPAGPTRVDANVRRVGSDGYRTVEEAIEAADAGDVIEIEPGVYDEALRINKPVELCPAGEPGTVRLRCDRDDVLTVTADLTVRDIAVAGMMTVEHEATVVFERCEISATGIGNFSPAATSAVTFTDCRLRGVDVSVSGTLTMVGCTVAESNGFSVMGGRSVADLRDCTFTEIKQAALAVYSGRVVVRNVSVGKAWVGLEIYDGTIDASDVTIEDTGHTGVAISGGTATLHRCQVIGSRHAGFEIIGGTVELTRCTARDNVFKGFDFWDGAKVTTTDCDSSNNGVPDGIRSKDKDSGRRVVRVGNVTALRQALDKAVAGDVIEIEPGNYRRIDGLRIRRAIEVRAAEGVGTVQLAMSRPLLVSAAATLSDIKIFAGTGTALIVRGESPLFERCEITSQGAGITVEIGNGAAPIFRHCTVRAHKRGLVLRNAGGRYEQCQLGGSEPVAVIDSHGPLFVDCEILSANGKQVRFNVDNKTLKRTGGGLLSGTVHSGETATVRLT